MVTALFDTNLLIDYLNGTSLARDELARYSDKAISIITWMEVMVGATSMTEKGTRDFLCDFSIVELDHPIAERTVMLRQRYGMKWPDAIVWASAQVRSMLFITRNTKDFPVEEPDIRVPYR